MGKPFVLPFAHQNRYYLYDVNTNVVMEVDEALFSLVDHVEVEANASDRRRRYSLNSPSYPLGEESKSRVLATVESGYAQHGLFSDRRPSDMSFPFSKEEFAAILENMIAHVLLNVTEQCNLRCGYCRYSGEYSYARTHRPVYMSEGVARKAVSFLMSRCSYILDKTEESLTVNFYGGEPLLNFPVIRSTIEFVQERYADRKDRTSFAITTNLTTRDYDVLKFLVDQKFSLNVSLDGPEFIHDRYRRSINGSGTFATVLANLEALRRMDEPLFRTIGFNIVLAPPYDIEAVVNFLESEELVRGHQVRLGFVDPDYTTFYDRFDHNEVEDVRRSQIRTLQQRLANRLGSKHIEPGSPTCSMFSMLSPIVHRPIVQMPSRFYPNGICLPGVQRTFVRADGILYMCEKIGDALPIGDLDTGYDLNAIWKAVDEYIRLSRPQCTNCWAVRFCSSCYIGALKGPTYDPGRRASYCEGTRMAVLANLKHYCELMATNSSVLSDAFPAPPGSGLIESAKRFLQYRNESANGVVEISIH